jgi:peptide/nickel transport system substrate-binding protein
MKKRLASILLCTALAATALVGCGKSEAKIDATTAGSAATEGIFTYAINGDTGNTLNPVTADDRWGLMTCHLLYAPAFYIYPDGSIDYILAESMEASEDGLIYTMKLKDGIKWSDGEAITADDIVYTYDVQNEQSHNLYIAGEPIAVEKVDDLTVTFTLPSVSASAMEVLSSEVSILPKHIFADRSTFDINMLEEEIVCSGPYVLEEYKTGEYLKFKKNPNYPNGEANIETIVYRVIESNDTATLALQNGEIDAWIGLPDLLEPYNGNENFNITNYSEGRVAYMRLNTASPNMQDQSYRSGILQALDRNEIMLAAYSDEDFYELCYSFLPVTNGYYTEDVEQWNQDLEEAKKLTENGSKSLKLCYVEEDAVQTNQALTIQAELKVIGIEVELCGMNQAAYMNVAYDKENAEYDIYLGGYVMGVDPDMYSSLFVTTKDNMLNYNNTEIDALFDEGNATLDESERQAIYKEVQQKVAEEAIFYPLGCNLRTLVTSARVGGIEDAQLVPIYTFGDLSKLELQ